MARPKTITPELIANIKAAQQKGLTRQETADLYGIGLSTVHQHYERTQRGNRPKADRAAVLARLEAGESVEAIAEAEGISAATVRRYRREAKGARPYKTTGA